MATYGNTGNTEPAGVSAAQQGEFNSSLPAHFQSQTQEVASGTEGAKLQDLSQVVIAPGGTDFSYEFTQHSYVLAGQDSKLNLAPSEKANGNPVKVDATLSGHDTITLNTGPDYVTDTGGHNTISASGGSDTISSAGHNLINALSGYNVIYGAPQDTINLGLSSSVVDAGYGRETINGGQNATISGYGHTSISGGVNNTINLTGSDTLMGSVAQKFAHANAGATVSTNDTVNVAANSSVYIDGKESTGMTVNVAASTVSGSGGHDTIFGSGNFGTTVNATALGSFTETTDNQSGIHTLTFSTGDVLSVNNVTVLTTDSSGHKVSTQV